MCILDFETIDRYKDHLTGEEKSRATIEKYTRDVREFCAYMNGREINKSAVLEYKEALTQTHAPRSVNAAISSLNSFFEYLGRHDCKVKMLKIQKQIFADKKRELTKKEYDRLLRAAERNKNHRLYYLMQTVCATGIRISELKYITVEAVKTGCINISCKGKLRTIFLTRDLCRMLKKYIEKRKIKSGTVFITRNGNPLDRSNIWSEMKKLCRAAHVEQGKVFPHNLRHLFARTFYAIKKDIVRLADILGHSSVNTTRIYTMESGEVHRRQLEQLNLLRC